VRSCSSTLERAAFGRGFSRAARYMLAIQLKRMPNTALLTDAGRSTLRASFGVATLERSAARNL